MAKPKKPPTPKPKEPASTTNAAVQPAQGTTPHNANTQGLVLPETEVNTAGKATNPPVKPETSQEKSILQKAGELLEKGEIGVLNKARDSITGTIDSAVESSGYSVPAMVAGAIGKAAVEVFFPTNVIDVIPGGKLGNAGRKATTKVGEKVLEKGAKETVEHTAQKEVKTAAGGGGGRSHGTKRRPKHRCELMKFKDMLCDGEKHHVMPDYLMRTGSAKKKLDPSTRIPGTPAYDDGLVICLGKEEHKGLHKSQDEKIAAAGNGGTISAGKAKEISASEASKKSGCNPKNLKKQLDRKMKTADDALLRSVKDARNVTEEMKGKYGPQGDI